MMLSDALVDERIEPHFRLHPFVAEMLPNLTSLGVDILTGFYLWRGQPNAIDTGHARFPGYIKFESSKHY